MQMVILKLQNIYSRKFTLKLSFNGHEKYVLELHPKEEHATINPGSMITHYSLVNEVNNYSLVLDDIQDPFFNSFFLEISTFTDLYNTTIKPSIMLKGIPPKRTTKPTYSQDIYQSNYPSYF